MRIRAGIVLVAMLTLTASLVAGAAWTAVRPADAAPRTRAHRPTLVAAVSTHYPCGDPMWLRARLRDGAGLGVRGVRVVFSFRLAGGAERHSAATDARGLAQVRIQPTADTAPTGVRVRVVARAAYHGRNLAAATWFTPSYT